MTIKQQGGVFGRNPSFNDADLSGNLSVDGTSKLTGDVAIGPIASPSSALHVYSPSSLDQITIDGNAGDNRGISLRSENSVRWNFYVNGAAESGGNAGSDLTIARYSDAGGYLGAAMAFERSSGKITAYGNLAFTSGKGIDFSATGGSGTSELLDDYEEGTWTPSLLSSLGGSPTLTTAVGRYIKIGNMVTVWFQAVSSDDLNDTAYYFVQGLPYSSTNDAPDYVGTAYTKQTTVFRGSTHSIFMGNTSSQLRVDTAQVSNALNTFAYSDTINGVATYKAA